MFPWNHDRKTLKTLGNLVMVEIRTFDCRSFSGRWLGRVEAYTWGQARIMANRRWRGILVRVTEAR